LLIIVGTDEGRSSKGIWISFSVNFRNCIDESTRGEYRGFFWGRTPPYRNGFVPLSFSIFIYEGRN
jgi:hypothetical protein